MSNDAARFRYRGQEPRAVKLHRIEDIHTVKAQEVLACVRPFWSRVGLTRLADITGMNRLGLPVANLMEPTLQGLYEYLERDAGCACGLLARAGKRKPRRVRLDTIAFPKVRDCWTERARPAMGTSAARWSKTGRTALSSSTV